MSLDQLSNHMNEVTEKVSDLLKLQSYLGTKAARDLMTCPPPQVSVLSIVSPAWLIA